MTLRFDQLRRGINAALEIIRMFKLPESVQSLDAHKKVLGFDEQPVHSVPVLLRIAQFKVKSSNEIRHELRDLHEGDVSTKACARTKSILARSLADERSKVSRSIRLTGIQ